MAVYPYDTKLYRPNVGIVLLNTKKHIFMGKRSDVPDVAKEGSDFRWQMPQGGIDGTEDPLKAAQRELFEETGVQHAQILSVSKHWYAYDFPDFVRTHFPNRQNFKGQQQKWFLMQCEESMEHIDLGGSGGEFCAMAWMSPDEILNQVIAFRRSVYEKVLKEFEMFF